jgi:hypothetical protein
VCGNVRARLQPCRKSLRFNPALAAEVRFFELMRFACTNVEQNVAYSAAERWRDKLAATVKTAGLSFDLHCGVMRSQSHRSGVNCYCY